jgi:hypothetical protein
LKYEMLMRDISVISCIGITSINLSASNTLAQK